MNIPTVIKREGKAVALTVGVKTVEFSLDDLFPEDEIIELSIALLEGDELRDEQPPGCLPSSMRPKRIGLRGVRPSRLHQ